MMFGAPKMNAILVRAVKENMVDIENDTVILTEKGVNELNTIVKNCMGLFEEFAPGEVNSLTTEYNKVYKTNKSDEEVFNAMLEMVCGGDRISVFQFLINERTVDYKYLKNVLLTSKKKPGLSVVKPQKYDA